MNSYTVLQYVLKSTFISGIFLGYYWIALRNKSFNYYNRFYLLLSLACSVAIPFFTFNWFSIKQQDLPVSSATLTYLSTQITSVHSTRLSWQEVALYIAFLISLFLLIVMAFNIIKVYQLKRRSAIIKMEEVDFIYTDLEHAPFSFLNNLFWKESISLDEDYGKKIFKHEITHIRQKHTLDILCCQIINAIFWMNPFNWLIQKELKAIHEFIADKEAVGDNNVEEFVKLLLQAHYGNHFLKLTHSFYYSSIKRRLFMLTTKSTTTRSYVRKLLALPVTLLAVGALSVSTIESKATPAVAPTVVPQQPNKPSPAPQPEKPLVKNDTTPTPAKAKEQAEKIKAENDAKNGNEITIKADTIFITSRTNGDKKLPANVIYYINDILASLEEVSKLKPEQIKSIHVWKGEEAIKIYGRTGADGVIEIKTKLVL
jgi:beta-lactamase regulating signal transducer with metallopeptidase domain